MRSSSRCTKLINRAIFLDKTHRLASDRRRRQMTRRTTDLIDLNGGQKSIPHPYTYCLVCYAMGLRPQLQFC